MSQEKSHVAYIRRLTIALLLSGALNIFAFAFGFYWLFRERPPTPVCELKPAASKQQLLAAGPTIKEMLTAFSQMPKDELTSKLSKKKMVEDGFCERDLALGCLVACHHFDINRALTGEGNPPQIRKIALSDKTEIILFPGLLDRHFHSIMQFANQEKWPLTSQGLFLALKIKPEASLLDAFYLTPEFQALETVLGRTEAAIDRKQIASMALEGDWNSLSSFAGQQRLQQDLSPAMRQKILLEYISKGSAESAYILLKTDQEFLKKIDDGATLTILKLLSKRTLEAVKYNLTLLTSARSDAVWQMASRRLYEYAGEPVPDKSLHHAALARFVPQASPTEAKNTSKARIYVVGPGDSLWKISKRYRVDVDTLKRFNNLVTDDLKPGSVLKIPNPGIS